MEGILEEDASLAGVLSRSPILFLTHLIQNVRGVKILHGSSILYKVSKNDIIDYRNEMIYNEYLR